MPGKVRKWIGRALRTAADYIEPQEEAFPEPPKTAPETRTEEKPRVKPKLNWDIPPGEQKYVLLQYRQRKIRQVAIFDGIGGVPTNEEILRFCRGKGVWGSLCLFSMRPRRKLVCKLKVPEEPPFEYLPWGVQKARLGIDEEPPLVDDPWSFTDFSSNRFPRKKVIGGRKAD